VPGQHGGGKRPIEIRREVQSRADADRPEATGAEAALLAEAAQRF